MLHGILQFAEFAAVVTGEDVDFGTGVNGYQLKTIFQRLVVFARGIVAPRNRGEHLGIFGVEIFHLIIILQRIGIILQFEQTTPDGSGNAKIVGVLCFGKFVIFEGFGRLRKFAVAPADFFEIPELLVLKNLRFQVIVQGELDVTVFLRGVPHLLVDFKVGRGECDFFENVVSLGIIFVGEEKFAHIPLLVDILKCHIEKQRTRRRKSLAEHIDEILAELIELEKPINVLYVLYQHLITILLAVQELLLLGDFVHFAELHTDVLAESFALFFGHQGNAQAKRILVGIANIRRVGDVAGKF